MGVGLERPKDGVIRLLGSAQDRLDRARVDLVGVVFVVQHWINDGGLLGRGISDEIANRVRRLVEERPDDGLC